MAGNTTIRLSPLAKRMRFSLLPGQPSRSTYGIVWGTEPMPAGGVCYVVIFTDRLRARVIGFITDDGRVFHADGPCPDKPDEGRVALVLNAAANGREGDVYASRLDGTMERISGYRGSFTGTLREVADVDTWNTRRSLVYAEFMATMFLRHCVFGAYAPERSPSWQEGRESQVSASQHLAEPVEIFADFSHLPLPDAIDALLYRIKGNPEPSGIERYALRVLDKVDTVRLRSLVTTGGVSLARIEHMNGFYINFDRTDMSGEDVLFLLSVEASLNRLSRVLDQMGAGLAPATASPSEEACSLIDQAALCDVSVHVSRLIEHAGEENPWVDPGTVVCAPGGEWDVRTRFVEACEALNLIVRFEYTFHYNAADGVMHVSFTAPSADAMPAAEYDVENDVWRTLDRAVRESMAREYGARIALVVAAAAFASSSMMGACYVELRSLSPRHRSRTVRIGRTQYMAELVRLAYALEGVSLRTSDALAALRYATVDGVEAMASTCEDLCPPERDNRELPAELRELLLADTARELGVVEDPEDPDMQRVNELRDMIGGDPAAAERGFIDLIEELQASCVEAELMSVRPLRTQFCENHLGRIMLSLFEDDPNVRVHRAPDALYFAQYELCNMYARADAFERALPEARRLLDMATTSIQAHFTLINVLARLNLYREVVEVAQHGLRVTIDRASIAYLFYRMAFAYWNLGELDRALACYRLMPSGEQMAGVAKEEMRELMNEMGKANAPDFGEAAATARSVGIPVPPTPDLTALIADAAVLLTDNGFFYLAGRCIYCLWRMKGSDELGVLSRSLLG